MTDLAVNGRSFHTAIHTHTLLYTKPIKLTAKQFTFQSAHPFSNGRAIFV